MEQYEQNANTLQFLTFTLGEEYYGVDITQVMEIRGWTEATAMPESPSYMLGVIDLRGQMIPIFDLRNRFGKGTTEPDAKHVVIIVAVGTRMLGLMADAVSDIVDCEKNALKAAPNMGDSTIDRRYIKGLLTHDEKMYVMLDAAEIFDAEQLESLPEMEAS